MKKPVTKSQATKAAYALGGPMEAMKPHLELTESDLPAIKTWDVGKKYRIEMEVEMTTQRKGEEYSSDPSKMSAGFKVLSVKDSGGK